MKFHLAPLAVKFSFFLTAKDAKKRKGRKGQIHTTAMTTEEDDNRIDDLADRFEAAWRIGRRISADDFLAEGETLIASNVDAIVAELRLVEQELRRKYQHSLFPLASELETQNRVGNYEILGLIGQGGMGKLYRAKNVLLDKIVAIKILPHAIASDPKAVERFERELKLLGNLSHPNIVHAHDAERLADNLLLVMEYVEGKNLQQILASGRTLPMDEALSVIRQVAAGLQYAHEQKIIHRDIKPANIMLTECGVAKILDFGLGKFHDELFFPIKQEDSNPLTEQGSTIGTVDFLSPEQWENPGSVDIRTDIYGLGCTFYTVVTGKVPYPGDKFRNIRDKMIAHVHHPLPSFSSAGITVSPVIEAILQKMCAKNREERFAVPQELLEALDEYQRTATVMMPAVPAKGGLRRLYWVVTGVAVVVCSLGLILLFKPNTPLPPTAPPLPAPPPNDNGVVPAPVISAAVSAIESEILSYRYRGDIRTARRLCREWLDEVLGTAPDTPEQREQTAIMKELLADCTLYGNDPNIRGYEFYVEEAGELYFQAITLTECPERKNILNSKRAVLQMISGNPSAGLRTLEVGTDRTVLETDNESGKEFGKSFLFYEAARGIGFFYCAETHAERQASLRRVLDMFRLNPRPVTDNLRELERFDLQLLCIRQLLETALAAGDETVRRDAATYLDPILLGAMAGHRDWRPYLRKDFDLAIRCFSDNLLKQVQYIYALRMDDTPREGLAQLLFYFTERDGFAIFLPGGLSDAKKFELDWTREDIRLNRVNRQQGGTDFLLDEQLTALVQAEWDAGRRVALSWNDELCFSNRNEGLSYADWTFEPQLTLRLFVGIEK